LTVRNKSIVNLAIVFISVLITYTLLEIGYRCYLYYSLLNNKYILKFTDKPVGFFDKNSGFKQYPNIDTTVLHYDQNDELLIEVRRKTNNHGHSSFNDVTKEKSNSEFRIAVIGDSFTECASTNWPDILDDSLNADNNLKKLLNVDRFRVLNFGRSGIGVFQFSKIYEHEVIEYHPDLVIVSLLFGDNFRRFLWLERLDLGHLGLSLVSPSLPVRLGNRDCMITNTVVLPRDYIQKKEGREEVRAALAREFAKNLPWFSPYPEVLAHLLGRKLKKPLGLVLEPRLWVSFVKGEYQDSQEGLRVSVQAMKTMAAKEKNILFLYNPSPAADEIYNEVFLNRLPPFYSQIAQAMAPVPLVNMTKYLDHRHDRQEMKKWFIYDNHFSDRGAQVYGRAVYKYLAADLIKSYLSNRAPALP